MPVILSSRTYAVEMLKDVFETSIVPNLKGKSVEKINQVIESLNQTVTTDEFTQVYSRRSINEKLPVGLCAVAPNGGVPSTILIDIGDFKQINDTYGYSMGGHVLQKVAEILQNNIQRKDDWIVRYGGDEFLVVLPDVDQKNAREIVKRIRQQIEQETLELRGCTVSTTISCGILGANPEDGSSVVDSFDHLNQKLHQGKHSDRGSISS